ncbi:MAG: AAA family ATPase, partial [Pseudorhodoplanes sp.]
MSGQNAVIEFLGRPETHGVLDVQRFETHGNLVFLAGQDAYKIKRAVRFDYMDFSTLEKRRLACQREVEINRRWTPDLYLGCVPIKRRPDGALSLAGEGETVEWAVHMRRFDQDDLLSSYAARVPIDRQLATQLADAVHLSHEKAERIANAAGIASYRTLSESIFHGLAMAKVFEQADIQRLGAAVDRQLARAAAIVDERAAHGYVRRCHGDLHLANIVLRNGVPTLYDAIEFDETLAVIDTLYDLAFLLMDLDFRGQRPAANVVLNRYLWRSGDERDLRGLAALPLFMALRATVRARVTIDRAAQETGQTRNCDLDLAHRYLAEALGLAVPPPPRLVVVAGLSGTGKTTLAAALRPGLGAAPGAVHFRSDLERKALAGVGEFERLPAESYAPQARQNVYARLHGKVALALEAQHSVIVDAVYDNEGNR